MNRRLVIHGALALLATLLVALAYADDPSADLPVEPGAYLAAPPAPPVHATTQAGPTQPPPAPPPVAPPVAPPPLTDPPPPPPVPPSFYGRDLATDGTLVYVLDVSGSMYTPTPTGTRLGDAQAALRRSVASLPASFRFNVLAYDCVTRYCFFGNGAGDFLVPATDANRAQAIRWTDALTPGGATGTGPACVAALADRRNHLVVLLTDGAPNCGAGPGLDNDPATMAAHRSQVVGGNAQRARVDVFGVAATGAFRAFGLGLASDNGGTYTDVR